MSALVRVRPVTIFQRCLLNHLSKHGRTISTSKKNSDTAAVTADNKCTEPIDTNKNWVSYGFDYNDKNEDTNVHHASFFFSVSLCLVLGGFMLAYGPDVHLRDWAQREAFLELRRREKNGLPLIDPNFVDPSNITLPSDDELQDVEIII